MSRNDAIRNDHGLRLLRAGQNPAIIHPAVTLGGAVRFGVYGSGAADWTLRNSGTILGRLAGIDLLAGGTVTGRAAAGIDGGQEGVLIGDGSGSVSNHGSITGLSSHEASDGSRTRIGTVGVGVSLADGGRVANGTTGPSGASRATITGGRFGVEVSGGAGQVVNGGTIVGTATYADLSARNTLIGATGIGVALAHGGSVENGAIGTSGALIRGALAGVEITGGAGAVRNAGTIAADALFVSSRSGTTADLGTAVTLGAGGSVRNGVGAVITGGDYGVRVGGGPGFVENQGSIEGSSQFFAGRYGDAITGFRGRGVDLDQGGTVVNGSASNTLATIGGGTTGVSISGQPGQVVNFGSITAFTVNYRGYYPYSGGTGISLAVGGSVTNGASNVASALIGGAWYGVQITGQAGTVINHGTILAYGGYGFTGRGLVLGNGGTVVNGSSTATSTALIAGARYGVQITGHGLVVNDARIIAFEGAIYPNFTLGTGVSMDAGTVVNGSALVTDAYIGGRYAIYGVNFHAGAGTVENDGTILATYGYGTDLGVGLHAGGRIDNGAAGVTSALIVGINAGVGVYGGPGTVLNDGTIAGQVAIDFGRGVTTATVVNRGDLIGASGTAINFGTAAATLEIGGDAVFRGTVIAGGAAADGIELLAAAAPATLRGLGSTFIGFTKIAVDANATWALGGANTASRDLGLQLAAGGRLAVPGVLDVGQALTLLGQGTVAVAGTGMIAVGAAGAGTPGRFTIAAATGGSAAGSVMGSGTIAASVVDNGSLVASAGTLALAGAVSGSGTVAIEAHAVLDADGPLALGRVVFAGGNARLDLAAPKDASALLSGFDQGDKIDLVDRVATGLDFSGATHVLRVTGAHGDIADLRFAGTYPGSRFLATSDGHGGTNITLG